MIKGKEVFEILMRENADMLLAFLRASESPRRLFFRDSSHLKRDALADFVQVMFQMS